ncbi:serine hydrolase [Streptomyces zhihengii]
MWDSARGAVGRRTRGGGGFSGTVSVVAEGRPVLQGAYGKASRRWDIDNTMDTRFRIASISKAFTAVTVLRLAQDGAVDLDEPLLPHVRHAHPHSTQASPCAMRSP